MKNYLETPIILSIVLFYMLCHLVYSPKYFIEDIIYSINLAFKK